MKKVLRQIFIAAGITVLATGTAYADGYHPNTHHRRHTGGGHGGSNSQKMDLGVKQSKDSDKVQSCPCKVERGHICPCDGQHAAPPPVVPQGYVPPPVT